MRIERFNESKILCFLIFGILLGIASLTLPTVVAITPWIEIKTDEVYYGVNEFGNMTIEVTGTLHGLSSKKCDFKLNILDEFEIFDVNTLKLVANGSPIEIIQRVLI